MSQNMSKHTRTVLTLDEMRSKAREDAIALIRAYGGKQNKAADAIGMNRGRLSFIRRGMWTQVAVNEVDLAMLATGRIGIEKDLSLTVQARELLAQLQEQMSELHKTNAELLRVMRKL